MIAGVASAAMIAAGSAEAAVRVATNLRLPTGEWFDPVLDLKTRAMRRRRPGSCEVAFVGGSTTYASIIPEAFTAHVRKDLRAYNAGFRLGVPRVYARWVNDVVIPQLRPRWLILGISAADLNDNGLSAASTLEAYLASRFHRRSPRMDALAAAVQLSAAVRYRASYRHPRVLLRASARGVKDLVTGTPAHRGDRVEATSSGHAVAYSNRHYLETENFGRLIRDDLLVRFSHGGIEFDAVRRTAELARRSGARVAITWLPIAPPTLRFFPDGRRTEQAVYADVRRLAVELSCPFVTPPEELNDLALFADPVHFNAAGANRFSMWLGRELAPTLLGETAAANPPIA